MTERPQCWAHGPSGRCCLKAGHTKDHTLTISWADDAVLVPLVGVAVDQPKALSLVGEAIDSSWTKPLEKVNQKQCVACGHSDSHDQGCAAKDCACYTGIYP